MSSILKALKKVEDDKATHRPEELKIDAEILRGSNTPRLPVTLIVVSSLLLLVGGSGATYLYMKRDKVIENVNLKPLASNKVTSIDITRTVITPPAQQEAVRQNEVDQLDARKPLKSVKHSVAVVKSVKPDIPVKGDVPPKNSQSIIPQQSSTVQAVPILRVNGIAFQNNSADSMAIINGAPASAGSIIDGATVEEIKRDKVLFKHNGERFEVQLGQSNR